MEYRIESDTLGDVKVPADKYYGAQTQRAVDNFPVSGLRLQPEFTRALAAIKLAAAETNADAGKLDPRIGDAIALAAREILDGALQDQFVVDVFQAGAGTSQNMNMNETLAGRAAEILGGSRGDRSLVNPNDHANMCQSTNDTIHTAIHIAAERGISEKLIPALNLLAAELRRKESEFKGIIKAARTHLQDAPPMRLGDEFGAFATMIEKETERIAAAARGLEELCIGGTAAGTGLNTYPGYRSGVVRRINEITGGNFRVADDLVETMQSYQAVAHVSGAIRGLAIALKKIADDLRLLGSGPRAGFAELIFPAAQPGSSIMPGKINPSHAEMLNMVCIHAIGCDAAVSAAAQAGQLQLNVMAPVIAYNLLQEIFPLASAIDVFARQCLPGIKADPVRCRKNALNSLSAAAALNPIIGYHRAAELSREAQERDMTIYDLVIEKKLVPRERLDEILDIAAMSDPPVE